MSEVCWVGREGLDLYSTIYPRTLGAHGKSVAADGGAAAAAAVACAGQWSASNVVGAWEQGRGRQQGGFDGGFDMRLQLRDAWNRDFRPCPGSLAAMRGAGTSGKRYLILTYTVEFDRVHYPLPLSREKIPPGPVQPGR